MTEIEMSIKEARQLTGLSQAAINREIGIPIRTLQDWEAGKRTPPSWVERLVIEKILSLTK